MKRQISFLSLVVLLLVGCAHGAIYQNYFTTNASPTLSGGFPQAITNGETRTWLHNGGLTFIPTGTNSVSGSDPYKTVQSIGNAGTNSEIIWQQGVNFDNPNNTNFHGFSYVTEMNWDPFPPSTDRQIEHYLTFHPKGGGTGARVWSWVLRDINDVQQATEAQTVEWRAPNGLAVVAQSNTTNDTFIKFNGRLDVHGPLNTNTAAMINLWDGGSILFLNRPNTIGASITHGYKGWSDGNADDDLVIRGANTDGLTIIGFPLTTIRTNLQVDGAASVGGELVLLSTLSFGAPGSDNRIDQYGRAFLSNTVAAQYLLVDPANNTIGGWMTDGTFNTTSNVVITGNGWFSGSMGGSNIVSLISPSRFATNSPSTNKFLRATSATTAEWGDAPTGGGGGGFTNVSVAGSGVTIVTNVSGGVTSYTVSATGTGSFTNNPFTDAVGIGTSGSTAAWQDPSGLLVLATNGFANNLTVRSTLSFSGFNSWTFDDIANLIRGIFSTNVLLSAPGWEFSGPVTFDDGATFINLSAVNFFPTNTLFGVWRMHATNSAHSLVWTNDGAGSSLVLKTNGALVAQEVDTGSWLRGTNSSGSLYETNLATGVYHDWQTNGLLEMGVSAVPQLWQIGPNSDGDLAATNLVDLGGLKFTSTGVLGTSSHINSGGDVSAFGSFVGSAESETNLVLHVKTGTFGSQTNSLTMGLDTYYTAGGNGNVGVTNVTGALVGQCDFATMAIYNGAGSNTTLYLPASWLTPDGARSYVLTNAILTQLSVRRTTSYTNAAVVPFF